MINKQVGDIKMNKTRRRRDEGPGHRYPSATMFYHIQQRKSLYFIDFQKGVKRGREKKIPEALKGTGND